MFSIKFKITRHTKEQENMTHFQEKGHQQRTLMTHIWEFVDKEFSNCANTFNNYAQELKSNMLITNGIKTVSKEM